MAARQQYRCEVCQISLASLADLQEHYRSDEHKQNRTNRAGGGEVAGSAAKQKGARESRDPASLGSIAAPNQMSLRKQQPPEPEPEPEPLLPSTMSNTPQRALEKGLSHRNVRVSRRDDGSQLSAHYEWKFAVVLGTPEGATTPEEQGGGFEEFLIETCQTFAEAGFLLGLVERTPQTRDRVIVLLRMGEARLMAEYRRLQIERWQETGAGIEFAVRPRGEGDAGLRRAWSVSPTDVDGDGVGDISEKLEPTEADKFQVMAEVLEHTCKLGNLEHLHDRYGPKETKPDKRILAVLPLKDRVWQEVFEKTWRKNGGIWRSCKNMKQIVKDQTLDILEEGKGGLKKGVSMGSVLAQGAVDVGASGVSAVGGVGKKVIVAGKDTVGGTLVAGGQMARQSIAHGINFVESKTGIDLDRDGDVGVRQRKSAAVKEGDLSEEGAGDGGEEGRGGPGHRPGQLGPDRRAPQPLLFLLIWTINI